MIKPDAMADGHMGKIIAQIQAAGFHFKALKMTRLSKAQAQAFYRSRRKAILRGIGGLYVLGPHPGGRVGEGECRR